MRLRIPAILGLFLAFALVTTTIYAAETTANIIGVVSDNNGSPLPGATVTAVNADTNFTRSTTTEDNGAYRIPLLPPGTYTISVEISGFAKETHKGIVLTVGKEISLDFTLKLSTASESIEVKGETPLVDATKSQLSQTVDQTAIKSLPLNGRDYTQLSLLAPGVKPVTQTNYGQFNIGGQRGDAVNYTIDGAENNFSYTNESRTLFTQEGVKEFVILTNRFSAEYGRSTSGVINVVSKSGTNDFHGNGFFFSRPDSFNSKDFFSEQSGQNFPSNTKQGGATFGGPIVKDKTFFFTAYEQTALNNSLSVTPTPRFPTGVRPKPVDLKLLTAKVDHQLNNDNSMVFRYNFEDRSEGAYYAGGSYVDGVTTKKRSQSFAVSENGVFSDKSYNEALFQYGRILRNDTPEVTDTPWLYRPSSATGWWYCCPQRFLENRIELLDSFTHVMQAKGEHTMKVGADYIHVSPEITFAQYSGGAYFFGTDAPFQPGNPDTYPYLYELGVGNPTTKDSNNQFSAFIQDDWRPSQNLTLNLGLRYDIENFSGPQSAQAVPGTDITLGKIPPVDKNNFGPRLGFTYDVKGKGNTIVRGGWGRYYKPIFHNIYNNALFFDGQYYSIKGVDDPCSIVDCTTPGITLPTPPDPSLLTAGSPDVRPMQDASVAYSDQTSIGMQHEFGQNFVINADYVRVRGHDLTREHNLNAPHDLVNPEPPPFPQYRRFRLLTTDAQSWYNALQLNVQKRYSNNLLFTASYTYSKTEEDAPDFFFVSEPNNQFDLNAEKGPGLHDERHVFAVAGVYDLPSGFQIGGVVRANSGIPINFVLPDDHNHDNFFGNDRPDFDPNANNACHCSAPPDFRVGTLGKNTGRGTSFFQVDMRVAKNFDFSHRYRLELIFEAFNLFNRANFNFRAASVNNVVVFDDPEVMQNLGKATEVYSPRQMQIGVKFDF